MTIAERILAYVGFSPSNINVVPAEAADQGLDSTQPYTADLRVDCAKAAIGVLKTLLSSADTKTYVDGGNGMSASYDRPAILKQIALIQDENGLSTELKPRLSGPRVW